jgi:hypothetical protein
MLSRTAPSDKRLKNYFPGWCAVFDYVGHSKYMTDETYRQTRAREQAEENASADGFRPLRADGQATERRLRVMARDHTAFLDMHSPFRASVMLALMRPAADVLADVKRTLQSSESSDDPTEHPASKPAIIAIGEALVAKGLTGDTTAIQQIADRIEGRPGMRSGDQDEDDLKVRQSSRKLLAQLVEVMTAAKLGKPIPVTDIVVDESDRIDNVR